MAAVGWVRGAEGLGGRRFPALPWRSAAPNPSFKRTCLRQAA